MKRTDRTYTLPEAKRLIDIGFEAYGIPVDAELVSSEGMCFTIVNNEDWPAEDLALVERYLKAQRDVVGAVLLAEMERCPNCGHTEEEVGFYLDGGESGYEMICNGCNHAWESDNWHDWIDYVR